MSADAPLPLSVRGALLRRQVSVAIGARSPGRVVGAAGTFLAPGRWPPPSRLRAMVLREGVARGNRAAARVIEGEVESDPDARRPGTPSALDRAAALTILAPSAPPAQQSIDLTVAAYLRGDLGRRPELPSPGPAGLPERAADLADGLRRSGHQRPVVIATFPGFVANPYSRLMEQAYEAYGLAALHVDDPTEIDAILERGRAAGYRVVIHLNAADRFAKAARSEAEASRLVEQVLRQLDTWIAGGACVITTIHNGPRLIGHRAIAERAIAQGIVDRARLVHVLSASTPRLLAGWIELPDAPCLHVPHPNYDGAYPPFPEASTARQRLGLDPRSSTVGGDVIVGLIGTLADRKGGRLLVDALARVPDPAPDGRRLRLLLAGMLVGRDSEELIRRAGADDRVVSRFGFIADEELPALVAALDVAVVPYGRGLNSGWLHLALTAGVPVIAPAPGTASEVVRPAALRTFTADDAESLAAALADAGALATDAGRRAARESVAALNAHDLSARLAAAIVAAADETSPSA